MSNVTYGWGKPIFQVYDGNTKIAEYIFPMTNESGMTISWEDVEIRHTIISPSTTNYTQGTLKRILGYYVTYSFDYSRYIIKEHEKYIEKLKQYEKAGYSIWLIPRENKRQFRQEVEYCGGNLDINIMRGGINAQGNRIQGLVYRTKNMVSTFLMPDPDETIYTVFHLHNRHALL